MKKVNGIPLVLFLGTVMFLNSKYPVYHFSPLAITLSYDIRGCVAVNSEAALLKPHVQSSCAIPPHYDKQNFIAYKISDTLQSNTLAGEGG
jgi:hypothetical protein